MNNIFALNQVLSADMLQASRFSGHPAQKVKDEFLAIFYKELLKQSFKAPKFGFSEEDNSISAMFVSDLMIEQLALQLARSRSFSADALIPPVNTGDIEIE